MFADEECRSIIADESVKYDKCAEYNDPFSRRNYNVIIRREVPIVTEEEPQEPEKNETSPENNTTTPDDNTN